MFHGTDNVKERRQSVPNDENKMNSVELKKIDPKFWKVHVTATSPVAVYSYNSTGNSWDKTDTVGTLYLYERNATPQYGLVVMNRKNSNNFRQNFGPGAEFVMEKPYILIRTAEDLNRHVDPRDGSHPIYCIWFYEPNDCVAAANILRDMGLKFEGEGNTFDKVGEQRSHLKDDSPSSMGNHGGNHLFQILRKSKGLPTDREDISNVMTAGECRSKMISCE